MNETNIVFAFVFISSSFLILDDYDDNQDQPTNVDSHSDVFISFISFHFFLIKRQIFESSINENR